MTNVPVAPGMSGMPIEVDGRASPKLLSQMVSRERLENLEVATVRP